MKTSASLLLRAATLLLLAFTFQAEAGDSTEARTLFAKPTREYADAPLWVWNDMMTERQVVETMRDLAGQQVKQVFLHPRPGLMTPYLSPEWFRLWKVALREAERLDMNVWIYDENSYPSGFAGGWVPELMPESRGRGLHLRELKKPPQWTDDLIAVFQLAGDKAENVTAKVRAGAALPAGRYVTAAIKRSDARPWHGGRTYVDLLYPGVTEKFLNVTLEAYRREIGSQFGKRVPGSFTDEPEIRPAGGLPWTEDLPQQFQKRWGYSLLENLASLSQPVGDWKKVRHNFYATLLSLFIERWAKPYYEYCAKNGLEFTGHYWEHDWPRCVGVTDNMAMAAWQQRPGIDILMNQYREDTHAQFGNVRACREVASLANQLGRKRTLVELYGAGGWDLRFEDMKRIGDWLEVLGVNTLDEHLSYVTIRGARKRDHPQSFSYHEPWWPAYHVSAGYFARLTAALTQGEQINRVLVIVPTTTAWMSQGDEARLKELGDAFFNLLMSLEVAQVEYDLGCEDVLANHGSVSGAALRVGKRDYSTVVLPPLNENLENKTVALLDGYMKAGGAVLCAGEPPARVDGAVSQRGAKLAQQAKWKKIEPAALPELLRKATDADGFAIGRQAGDKGILFHHRRQFDDGELLFLVNTSIESPSAGVIESRAHGVEQWDLQTGKSAPYRFETRDSGVRAAFSLPPSGSLLLFLSKKPCAPAPVVSEKVTTVAAAGPPQARRVAPNVLTLDVVDITAGGETRTNAYFYQAQQFAFQKNGMDRNPWDSAVQFKDEIITKKFPEGSGFAASYRFTIEGAVPKDLAIVIERSDLYTVTCNGKPVRAAKGAWWLDKAFGRIAIASAARVGENVVTIKASPMTVFHELEPAYVLGNFTLKPVAKGFVIAPDQPLKLGRWNEQGAPFFSAGVAYRETFDVASPAGRYVVALPSWYGSVARILVNGKLAGHIVSPPWRCDVSDKIKRGANSVEVVVIGTLKNTLGPHHGKQPLGSAWPRMFQIAPKPCPAPGADYDTVGYGLFEPFVLEQVTP
ncbi:MAG: glycosyl hydrolase [Verrucomicrobiia bacterium]